MPLPKEIACTLEDIYALPAGERAELIHGQMHRMAPPGRIHQRLVLELGQKIGNYIESQNGSCQVYPAPFAVLLNEEDETYVEPDISVICDKNKLTDNNTVLSAYFFIIYPKSG